MPQGAGLIEVLFSYASHFAEVAVGQTPSPAGYPYRDTFSPYLSRSVSGGEQVSSPALTPTGQAGAEGADAPMRVSACEDLKQLDNHRRGYDIMRWLHVHRKKCDP